MATETKQATSLWYKDAIIYQLHVRAFCDSDGDGIGDFRGLMEKLDYIQDLGVTAIWLLPFYPSPLKDDGYDIANYTDVNPIYGTLDDFQQFLEGAHRRDLRVITELVLNHTSDQHPWFQKARRAKPGDPARDFYVWSDDPKKYAQTRVIFQDFEASNWTWDPVASAYFWHRFYSHQPDLNFDNPAVREAMFQVLDFWLDMGVDGLRLDAVPYLYEREGTNCENLPETHQFLQELRTHIDGKYEDRMILAEANQWPEDAAAYFGDGDECHMNFHFPLMPRLFMSVHREDRFPVIDIMDQTPEIPFNCQWAIFLRNHDELTLEMVTDEERDYMYRSYAEDPQSRINLGIRRRLAPLLKNNRRRLELMNALLFSLPGTPIIYYGDEIRMGDNIYLGDRDSVRTPMQWSPDRNAGFSKANPQRLFLPPIIDPEYHFATRNVETEQANPHSMLWWMRRAIRHRKESEVFGRGSIQFLMPDNHKVLAYLRELEGEVILVVGNLSRFVQCVELDLSRFRGYVPIEMFGKTKFPMIGELPYFLTLSPHGFYWFSLERADGGKLIVSPKKLHSCAVEGEWDTVFSGKNKTHFESALPSYLHKNRWFAGKARTIQNTLLADVFRVPPAGDRDVFRLVLIRVEYTEGEPEHYLLPVVFATGTRADNILGDRPQAGIMAVDLSDGTQGFLCDATWEREFWLPLAKAIADKGALAGLEANIAGITLASFEGIDREELLRVEPTVHGGEQSNTSAIYGTQAILKLFRRVSEGVNPDWEIGRFLTEKARFPHTPEMLGALEARRGRNAPAITVAVLQKYVANEGDAWVHTLDELSRFVENIVSEPTIDEQLAPEWESATVWDVLNQPAPEAVKEMIGPYLQSAELLGQRTAEMHAALAADSEDPAFAPEHFSTLYQRSLYQSMRTQAIKSFQLLQSQKSKLPEATQHDATRVINMQQGVVGHFHSIVDLKITGLRIRCHGDYHLGQVLYTGKDFVIIDFEGEPARSLGERRIKRSPLRDVAGMLRSFDYASSAASLGSIPGMVGLQEAQQRVEQWLYVWYLFNGAAFLRSYLKTAAESEFLPEGEDELRLLLNAYMLDKLMYELSYELNNRPDWARIPLKAIINL